MRTINIYSFNELSDTAKKTAIEANRYINVNYDDWCAYAYNYFKEFLTSVGFYDIKIRASGFCSQGDGASFIASIKARDALKLFNMDGEASDYLDVTCHVTDGYSHENTVYFEVSSSNEDYDKIAEDLAKYLNEFQKDHSRKYYKVLEKEYFYLISDECVSEFLQDSDLEFFEDGTPV